MKSFGWFLAISLSLLFIFPFVVSAQCEAPFIDCNGLCTLPNECGSQDGGAVSKPDDGGTRTKPPGDGGTRTKPSAGDSFTLPKPIEAESFADVMNRLAQIVVLIGLPLVVIMIIYAGSLYVFAQGSEERIKKAHQAFFWAVVGALLIVGAEAISLAIQNFALRL